VGGTPPQRTPNIPANISVLAVLATMVAACTIAAPMVSTANERPGFATRQQVACSARPASVRRSSFDPP
jgi:hypothetical protein